MQDKLKNIKLKFEKLSEEVADPNLISNQDEWRKKVKEHATLAPIVGAYDQYVKCLNEIEQTKELINEETDSEMKELAQEELAIKKQESLDLEQQIRVLLLPKDPNDDKNVVLEIRAGTGGEEAALFGADLMRMYMRFAERHNLKTEILNINETELGGVKDLSVAISGKDVYRLLKFESGTHRVQRVPETESQGRIQTSAATVVVMPEVEDVQVDINPNDLKIDTYRAGGAGGQHVNKTESAIRITHLPTGIVVQCMDERSQHKNKEKAMRVLKTRIYDHYVTTQEAKISAERKSQVGSGDRSERIRTYNFPQSRVSDHRINLTLYKLDAFLDGDLDEMIEALNVADRAAKLEAAVEG